MRREGLMGYALLGLVAAALAGLTPAAAAEDEDMLYLVEFEATEAGAPTTRAQAIELLEGLIVPSLESLDSEGRIRAGGLLVGARAGVFVVGARSNDEVSELVRALPAWGVWSWKVTPLERFAHRVTLEKKVVEALRAQ